MIIVKNQATARREPVEPGNYPARCYGMVVTGTEFNELYGNLKTNVIVLWEMPTERIEIEKDGAVKNLPRGIHAQYNLSLNEKATLRKTLESWRGKAFDDKQLAQEGFDIASIIGAPCLLNVLTRQAQNGNEYNYVSTVARLPKGMEVPEMENPRVEFDIRDENQPLSDMEKLPEWIQERIRNSAEYKARIAGASVDGDFAVVESDEDLPF